MKTQCSRATLCGLGVMLALVSASPALSGQQTSDSLSVIPGSFTIQETADNAPDEPPTEPDPETAAASPDPPPAATPRRPRRITRPPKNHGHFLTTNRFDFENLGYPIYGCVEYVTPGRFLVSDNNSACPDNRFIFQYQHFNNALDAHFTDASGPLPVQRLDLDQVTVGFEKILDARRCWSLEMRLPVYSTPNAVYPQGFSTQNPSTGNLVLIGKRVLSCRPNRVISGGLGVSLPTGEDARFIVVDQLFEARNQAVHFAPFLATQWTPGNCWFVHGFMQVDVPTIGNEVFYRTLSPGGANAVLGELTDQTLFAADLSVGYWWYRNPQPCGITGVSTQLEFHYVSTVNDADLVSGATALNTFSFETNSTRFDLLNVTAGLDIEINRCVNFRVAGVLPLRAEPHRFFDSELQCSLNYRY